MVITKIHLKDGGDSFRIFFSPKKKQTNRDRFDFEIFSRVLMIKHWFLAQNDAED